MKASRFTAAHQSITFSRRMMLVGGAQAALGGALIARLGYLSIAQNEHYQLLVREQPGPADHRPAAPRLDRRPRRKADRDQSLRLSGRHHPGTTRAADRDAPHADADPQPDAGRRRPDHQGNQGVARIPAGPGRRKCALRPICRRSRSACPKCLAYSRCAASPASTRPGPAVGHLVGYVGAASAKEYEEEKNPLLVTPGFKIGKEGLEKTLEKNLRGQPGGQRVELTARGKLVRELEPKPDRSGQTVQLAIDAGLQEFAARRLGEESGSCTILDCHDRRHPLHGIDAGL